MSLSQQCMFAARITLIRTKQLSSGQFKMVNIAYRPDIDGLRTLAVIPVILFHAGASWLPGGFVGVDIFFVISGYLISSIIFREVKAGQFSFLRFYERRLRRIIPALLLMLLVTIIVFQVFALPDQAQSTAESGISALLSFSNFWFWRESGYFAPTAEFIPLLHTWSLAVEEQFYLVFPAILLTIWRFKLPDRFVLVILTIAAFGISYWLSVNKPSAAYYLLPARAWEMVAGAVLASGALPKVRGAILRQMLPAIGVGMILLSIFWIRSDMTFPGWVALIPCIGAAMIIHSDGRSWVASHILSARPMIFIGLLSYSLYLWHWPVLAFLRVRTSSINLDPAVAVSAIILTFMLAWLSWRYVERPFRDRRHMPSRRMLTLLGGGSVAVLALAGLVILFAGFPGRISEPVKIALAAASDIDPLRIRCQGVGVNRECRFGNPDLPVTYAIIGDSHAAAIRPAIEASGIMGNEAGTLFWTGACPMLEGARLRNHQESANCMSFKASVWDEIAANPRLHTIVLAGRWPFQMTGWLPESAGANRSWLVDDQTTTSSIEENAAVFQRSFSRTIDRLRAMGKEVIVIGSTPEPGFDVPKTVAMALHAGLDAPRGIRREMVEARAGAADEFLARILNNRDGVRLLSIWPAFCSKVWCDIENDGAPIYSDDDHLSLTGAVRIVAPAIAKKTH
jgi:peptidoglycan/LPS O-acetylase OafA/YrhL